MNKSQQILFGLKIAQGDLRMKRHIRRYITDAIELIEDLIHCDNDTYRVANRIISEWSDYGATGDARRVIQKLMKKKEIAR